MIYFIEIVGDTPVKIGHTSKPVNQRLSQLQVGNPKPMRVVATVDGDKEMEGYLHAMFAEAHIRGEWYERTEAVLDFLEGCSDYESEDS